MASYRVIQILPNISSTLTIALEPPLSLALSTKASCTSFPLASRRYGVVCALGSFTKIVVSIERLERLDELAMDNVQLLYTIWCSRQLGYIVCGLEDGILSPTT